MKVTFLLLVLNLTFLSLRAQTEREENTIQKEYKYNGKPVSEEKLLQLLNRDFIKFCRKEKKESKQLIKKNRKSNRRINTLPPIGLKNYD
jgi:hypothetical protein